jgi:hypothetical protein
MGDECTFQGNRETYGQFHWPSIIRERAIIAGDLDSEDTEASAKDARSALLCPSLRLEETGKVVRRVPRTAPPKTSAAWTMTEGKEGADRGRKSELR